MLSFGNDFDSNGLPGKSKYDEEKVEIDVLTRSVGALF
jgi:hypothetical protein